MFLYHYITQPVESLKTSDMLQDKISKDKHDKGLLCFFQPLGKDNIKKLRSNKFTMYKNKLFLYKFNINHAYFTKADIESTLLHTLFPPSELTDRDFNKLFKQWYQVSHNDISKQDIIKYYNTDKEEIDNVDKYVDIQINKSKYYLKYKDMYASNIQHLILYIKQPIENIILVDVN